MSTPEAEAVVTVHPATRTAPEEDSGTSQPGHSIKTLTLTTEAPQWGRDSGDTWTTMNKCLNVTRVFFSSLRRQRSWGRDRADSTTLSSASTTRSTLQERANRTYRFTEGCSESIVREPNGICISSPVLHIGRM